MLFVGGGAMSQLQQPFPIAVLCPCWPRLERLLLVRAGSCKSRFISPSHNLPPRSGTAFRLETVLCRYLP
jgi:hypothetical protein